MCNTFKSAGAMAIVAVLACTPKPSTRDDIHVKHADAFTQRYAKSRLARWNVQATAAGRDCAVLMVETSMILEDSMIEAIHYGAGAYDIHDGGVQQFLRERAFRGVAYKDRSGRLWTYGAVTPAEAEGLASCH